MTTEQQAEYAAAHAADRFVELAPDLIVNPSEVDGVIAAGEQTWIHFAGCDLQQWLPVNAPFVDVMTTLAEARRSA